MPTTISLVTLQTNDLDVACDFYGALFGREPAMRVATTAFFDLGAIVLSLFTALTSETGIPPPDGPIGGTAFAVNQAHADEVDEVVRLAIDNGATVVSPAVEQEWGGYSAYVADPDGHLIEIAHNPHWGLVEDGTVVPDWRTP